MQKPTMNLHVINTGNFKLDGGAMHGVVPKSLWQRHNPADEHNLCSWAMRCLLLEQDGRLILIDNGIGNKQNEKFFGHYHLHGEHSLEASLNLAGFSLEDITDNLLTHLHFDHCGGGIEWNEDRTGFKPKFPNASYWVNKKHWEHALHPNPREKASFLTENIKPMQELGQLSFLGEESPFEGVSLFEAFGHTEAQVIPKISYKGHTVVFMADLLPSIGHIPLAWVMGYDIRPLETLKEKEAFFEEAVENEYVLFFEHDPVNECCTLKRTEKGIRLNEAFPLSALG